MVIWFVRGKPVMDIPDPLLNVWTFLSRLPHLFHAKLNEKKHKINLWTEAEGRACPMDLPLQPGGGMLSAGPTLSWRHRTTTRGS